MQKQENLNQEKTKKKKSNFRKNLFVTLLFFGNSRSCSCKSL